MAGREPLDRVDVRLLHQAEELPRIGRERLDVAALPFGVDRVEGERRLPRARQAGDDRQLVARDRDADVPEIVLAGTADDERVGATVGSGIGSGSAGPPLLGRGLLWHRLASCEKRRTETTPADCPDRQPLPPMTDTLQASAWPSPRWRRRPTPTRWFGPSSNSGSSRAADVLPGMRSLYRWEGRIADEPETLILLKTTADRVAALKAALPALHPYQVPELLTFAAADGLPAYLRPGWRPKRARSTETRRPLPPSTAASPAGPVCADDVTVRCRSVVSRA